MTTGKKPALVPQYVIVREFRGARLYLATTYTGRGYRWVNDRKAALPMTLDAAMNTVEAASRDWGTACAVLDTDDNLLRPSERQSLENRTATAMRERMAREVAAAGNARVMRQAAARQSHRLGCGCDHCEGLRGGAQS